MISFDHACDLLGRIAQPLGIETVPLEHAHRRILARRIRAAADSPPVDCAAMDGYAVRSADLPGRLRIAGTSLPGSPVRRPLEPRCTVRVFTGAPLPAGADRVVIQEEVTLEGDRAVMPAGGPLAYVRRRGFDFRAGDELLAAGRPLTPRALVAAAAADVATVAAWRRPRVALIATGDELAAPGAAQRRPGAISDSVSFAVAALAREWGGEVVALRRSADDLPALERIAAEMLELADLVVVGGGASVGERDFAQAMFVPAGLQLEFDKVAIKPGKPVWLGRAGGTLVLGLPGNPTSAMVTARLFLAPLITGLGGGSTALAWEAVTLAAPLPATGDRENFSRARCTAVGAEPLANQDSGAQQALAEADLLLRTAAGAPARDAGETIDALRF